MIQNADPPETAELLAFTRTVEAKSLSRAAAELRVPRATIGRRLARLEERLGVRLLQRTTRSLALTEAGDVFYRHAKSVLDALEAAESCVRTQDTVVRGDVRVSVPPDLGPTFSALLTSFCETHPEVRLLVEASSRIVDLRREGYDVALRATSSIEPGLVARKVLRHSVIAVASPGYLAAHGVPKTVKDLKRHRCVTAFARGEIPQVTWPAGRGVVHVTPAFSSNDLRLLRDVAVAGLGIALLPRVLLGDLVERGALVQVLAGAVETENHIAVVYPERALVPPQVRAVIEALVAWAPRFAEYLATSSRPEARARKRAAGQRQVARTRPLA